MKMWMYGVNKISPTFLPALLVCLALANMLACGGSTSAPGKPSGDPPPGNPSGDSSFNLDISPSTLALVQGNQSYATLATTAVGGFTSSITPATSGAPDGVTVTFDPGTIPVSESSNVVVAVESRTATGNYPVVVSGNGGGIAKNVILTLTLAAEVNLTWQASPSRDVIGYIVGRSTTSGSGYSRLNSDLILGTSYTDQTAESDHTYYYVVTAVNSINQESVPSNEAVTSVP